MENTNIEILLDELLEEVKLITIQTKVEALQKFKEEFLTSDLRKQMYEAFDGIRPLAQISADLECKINTLQGFAQTLLDKDLVKCEYRGNARILSKSLSRIAIYYKKKQLEEV